MTIAFEAMIFAREVHKSQRRKYTGNPYADHLAEVTGIAMSVWWYVPGVHPDIFMATCWLHDSIEDQGITHGVLTDRFGVKVADGVQFLSDTETGNRDARKALSRERLAAAPAWVQTIKVADLISNTASIVQHDPRFAAVYLEETCLLLDVLTNADARLLAIARAQVSEAFGAP